MFLSYALRLSQMKRGLGTYVQFPVQENMDGDKRAFVISFDTANHLHKSIYACNNNDEKRI